MREDRTRHGRGRHHIDRRHLVATGQSSPVEALRRNLAVGPPSLEQIAFTVGLDGHEVNPTPPVVTAASRLLDAPRRLWSRLTAPPAST